jgi:hypothetical protein
MRFRTCVLSSGRDDSCFGYLRSLLPLIIINILNRSSVTLERYQPDALFFISGSMTVYHLHWSLPFIFINLLTATGPTPWESPEFQCLTNNAAYPLSFDTNIIPEEPGSKRKTREEYLRLYIAQFRKLAPYSRRQLRFACTKFGVFDRGRVIYKEYMETTMKAVESRVEEWLVGHKLHPKDHMLNRRGRMLKVRVYYFIVPVYPHQPLIVSSCIKVPARTKTRQRAHARNIWVLRARGSR